MNRTNIEWAKNPDGRQGYTWNAITGCLNHDNGLCKGGGFPCYAYKLANGRLKPLYLANMNSPTSVDFRNGEYKPDADAYLDPFYPRFWEERLAELTKRNDRLHYDGKKVEYPISPRGIFLCDMADWLGIGVPKVWTEKVLDEIWGNKGYDRFYTLTKQAQRLPEFSPFPDNCWVGVTATTQELLIDALDGLSKIEAKVKYISFEPLLEAMNGGECEGKRLDGLCEAGISWLIIGACTATYSEMVALRDKYNRGKPTVRAYGNRFTLQPKIEWVREIVEAADKAGVRVFLKDNLKPLLVTERGNSEYAPLWANGGYGTLRQEMPGVKQ